MGTRCRTRFRKKSIAHRHTAAHNQHKAMSGAVPKRLPKELEQINKDPVAGISVAPVVDNPMQWQCSIDGPADTPYEGGTFKFVLTFPSNYPFHSPTLKSETKILHPNFTPTGELCSQLVQLEKNWSPQTLAITVLKNIQQLLANPSTQEPLCDPAMMILFTEHRDQFDAKVREFVDKYAK